MDEEKRNMFLFFAISMAIMLGYSYFFEKPTPAPVTVSTSVVDNSAANAPVSAQKSEAAGKNMLSSNESAHDDEPVHEIAIDTPSIGGILSSCGLKIDHILLKNYENDSKCAPDSKKSTSDPEKSTKVSIFGEQKNAYYSAVGLYSDDKSVLLPDENTHWKTDAQTLSENSPIVLTWDNKNGLLFEKHISIDSNYVITVVDKVKNYGDRAVTLRSRTLIHREFAKPSDSTMTFYEGPLGYLDGKLKEISYEDISKAGQIKHNTKGGWFGITDKYWLVAFIPDQNVDCDVSYRHSVRDNTKIYEVESLGNAIQVAPSSEISLTNNLFVGAKEIKTLDLYEEKLGVKHFDLAIDFGCLYIMTKPLLYSLAFAKDILGNMGLGILLITLLIKLLLLPFAHKSYKSMNRLKEIQPKIQYLQKKYADDKVKLGQEVSELYKKEKINPMGGCLPSLIQSPVLFALYKVLYISIEMRHAPFIWWIKDLSLPDPLSLFNLFGLIPITLPTFLQIGIWPLLMGLSMLLQQKMGPKPTDPAQASMTLILPLVFTFMFAQLPSGLVIYWTFSNILSILQQYYVNKHCVVSSEKKEEKQ
ncbi:MAG: membrane protein insertase YidC [Holosporaceae bacterium]|jgi:YidC/Oxa1 family membrane protein insertase|nr:membrane protein insertase YidC [Holosporaceae bacterium]